MQATNPRQPAAAPLKITLADIPAGAAGTRATLKLMARAAVAGAKAEPVYSLARALVQPLPPRAALAEVNAIFLYVRDRVRYTHDVLNVESLQSPGDTIKLKTGDCDDKSTLAAALLLSIGFPARFVAIGNRPHEFSHVYVQAQVNSQWITLETCLPWSLGKTAQLAYTLIQPIGEGSAMLQGLGIVSRGTGAGPDGGLKTAQKQRFDTVSASGARDAARQRALNEAKYPGSTAAFAALQKIIVGGGPNFALSDKQWLKIMKPLDRPGSDRPYFVLLAKRWIDAQKAHGGVLSFGHDILPQQANFLYRGKPIASYDQRDIAHVVQTVKTLNEIAADFQRGAPNITINPATVSLSRLRQIFPTKSLFVAARDFVEAAAVAIGIAYGAAAIIGHGSVAAGSAIEHGAASTGIGTGATAGSTVAATTGTTTGSTAATTGAATTATTGSTVAATTGTTAAGGVGTAAKVATGAKDAASASSAIGDVVKTVTGGGSLADTLKNLTQIATQYKLGQAQLDLLKQQQQQQAAATGSQVTGAAGTNLTTATTTKPLPGWAKAAMIGGGLLLGKVLLLAS